MELKKIVIDAMGGDDAPKAMVEGAVWALNTCEDIYLILTGDEPKINEILKGKTYDKNRMEIIHTTEVITNDESPVLAIRRKKDASLVRALYLVKDKKAEALVSAGSTGAVLAGGTLVIGRMKGIERPALGSLIPNEKGMTLLIDCGANVDSKPHFLHQFAKMGSIYYENILDIKHPKVALVNNGSEDKKGNALVKDTFPLLKNDTTLNFIGNIEARDIPTGEAHVIVCDGFVGNVILKLTEGLAASLLGMVKESIMSTTVSKIGGLLIKKSMKSMKKKLDYTEYGGAPLLGLEALVVKAHGSSNAKAFKNAILQCKTFIDHKVNDKIKQQLL